MSSKQPPTFDPENDVYENWKSDIEVWQLLVDEKVKQGPAVYLSLQGDARSAVRHLKPADLAKDDGVNLIVAELDKVYIKDETARTFQAIKNVIEFRREAGQNFSKFIVEFQSRFREFESYNIVVPDSLKAYFLIKAANLNEEHERLVRATAKMEFNDMKDQLQKVFGQYCDKEEVLEGALPIKEECLYGAYGHQSKSFRGYNNFNKRFKDRKGQNWKYERPLDCNWKYDHAQKQTPRSKDNPKDEDGNIMRCHECDSKKHLVRQCPHRKHDVKITAEECKMVNVTLVTENLPQLQDGLGKGILDSGCTKTVAGEVWMNEFIKQLEPQLRETIKRKDSSAVYRFGDGKEAKSIEQIKVPLLICDQDMHIWVDVVKSHIPLLISLPTMSNMGLIIDTGKHQIISNGNSFPLDINISGHYEIPVTPGNSEQIYISEDLSDNNMKKIAVKLHRQFCHPSKERLIKLLKQSQLYDATFYKVVEAITDSCQFCLKYKSPKLKPVVAFPRASDYHFNQVVSMDLKEIKKGQLWILHMVDAATCYTAAAIINNKRKETIVKTVFQIWLAYFGAPQMFHSDCGREFNNDLFREMNDLFNIETSTTPGESPFSNGKVERANKLLYETMRKTMEDTGCGYDIALAWAVSAKNCLQSHLGYSPNMLVFGKNVNLPMVSNSQLPALESNNTNIQELVRSNLNALHKARENFIKAEASERIKRALRHQTRTFGEVEFSAGEKVLFKRRHEKRWRGPGIVLGKDSNFVLIRHGAQIYRCHPCQLLKQTMNAENDTITKRKNDKQEKTIDHICKTPGNMDHSSDSDNESETNFLPEDNSSDIEVVPAETGIANNFEPLVDETNTDTETEESNENPDCSAFHTPGPSKIPRLLKRILPHNNAGLKESTCSQPTLITNTEPQTEDKKKVELEAKLEELDKLVNYDVYDLVEDNGQATISCKWLIKSKGDKVKARLVARGFEENFQDRKDSPTCTRESLRMIFAVAASMKWRIHSMDISSAFLQGNKMDREVYVKPPKESNSSGKLWKLKRCLYGLVDAPREWYQRVAKEMIRLGGKKSLFDKCLFLWHSNEGNKLIGILVAHVDDFQYCGSESFQKVIDNLKTTFKVSTQEQSKFKYIGVNVNQEEDMTIRIDQNEYCRQLEEIPIETPRKLQVNKPLSEEEKTHLKSAAGRIQWATSQTRPEMAYHTCQVSNSGKNPCVKQIIEANKAIRKLKTESSELVYPTLGNPENWSVVVFADGSHASLPSGCSQGGCIVFLTGNHKRAAPLAWKSKRIERVTKSPLATEISAVADGADLGFLVSSMVQEIFQLKNIPVINIRTDSKSLKDHLGTDRVIKDPRLRVDTARLRQMTENGELTVTWVPGTKQLADCLTKKGAPNEMLKACLSSGVLSTGE